MRAVRRLATGAALLAGVVVVSATTPVATLALLSRSANGPVNTLGGAVFTPNSIPAPSVSLVAGVPRVTWDAVSLSSGYPVTYTVTRTPTSGTALGACPSSGLSTAGGTVLCDDTAATGGATYTYTVQPVLERAGTITWSRPASPASTQVSIPRLVYGGVGPTALFSGSSPTVVTYPTGTVAGDVLVMIARNARNKAISVPAGWTTLVSNNIGNPASAFMVAWRVADAASSVTIAINSSNDGAVASIVRWVRTPGVTATPVLATTATVWAESATSVASFGATPLLTTNQSYASVVTIASTITGQVPALPGGSPFQARASVTATSAGSTFSLAVADQLAVANGAQVASPTWTIPLATNTWQVLTLAFA